MWDIKATVILNFKKNQVKGEATLYAPKNRISASPDVSAPDNPDNEINLFITLEGNEDNDFKGSTIKLEINPEIR